MIDLNTLAAAVEGAEGPSRELDENIALALGWTRIANTTHAGGLVGRWVRPDGNWTSHDGPPQWTASIDAAASLLPKGVGGELLSFTTGRLNLGNHIVKGLATISDGLSGQQWAGCSRATPALALTAACLRARAAQPNPGGE